MHYRAPRPVSGKICRSFFQRCHYPAPERIAVDCGLPHAFEDHDPVGLCDQGPGARSKDERRCLEFPRLLARISASGVTSFPGDSSGQGGLPLPGPRR